MRKLIFIIFLLMFGQWMVQVDPALMQKVFGVAWILYAPKQTNKTVRLLRLVLGWLWMR